MLQCNIRMSDSRFERNQLFVATAVVAAHANVSKGGFRQRDVKFWIELFSNWVESALPAEVLEVQNNQILRYIICIKRIDLCMTRWV